MSLVKLLLSAALLLAPLTAQIRVTTRLVEVNVIVRDKNGPVRGLAKADFEIFDRGKARPIAFFSENSADAARPAEPLPPNVFTNRPERRGVDPASATVILFDAVNTPVKDQLRSRKQFLKFLEQLRPQDRVAVYSLGTSLRVLSDFTNDPKRLMATVASYRGRLDGSPDTPPLDRIATGDEKSDAIWNNFLQESEIAAQDRRVELTLEAVEAIARHIGDVPGRKNLIWVSAAFPFESYGYFPKTYSQEITRMARALSGANIAMHPVDARGLIGLTAFSADGTRPAAAGTLGSQTPTGQPVMDMLAQATGGRVFKNNDIAGAIRTVLDESESTYTLAFYPQNGDLDSTFHKLRVKAQRGPRRRSPKTPSCWSARSAARSSIARSRRHPLPGRALPRGQAPLLRHPRREGHRARSQRRALDRPDRRRLRPARRRRPRPRHGVLRAPSRSRREAARRRRKQRARLRQRDRRGAGRRRGQGRDRRPRDRPPRIRNRAPSGFELRVRPLK
jgi:VWFA-related protein